MKNLIDLRQGRGTKISGALQLAPNQFNKGVGGLKYLRCFSGLII